MTNEQREAIELLEGIRDNTWTTKYIMSSDSKKADTVLSLIKENSAEIQQKNTELAEKSAELEKKDKQIDLMAEYWNTGLAMCDNCDRIVEKYEENNCQNCIKRYFAGLAERKVEDE